MSTNLQNYNPTHATSDWNLWVSLVKKAHKSKGINLTQAQSLILAKDSYPGKGNVLANTDPSSIPTVDQAQVPPNPTRRKKAPAPPPDPPQTHSRSGRDHQDHLGGRSGRGGRDHQGRGGYYEEIDPYIGDSRTDARRYDDRRVNRREPQRYRREPPSYRRNYDDDRSMYPEDDLPPPRQRRRPQRREPDYDSEEDRYY